jgi:type II secretory pathway pseudopilin PulG
MMNRDERGFTLIELTLAMSFVAILLISVAMLSIQLTNQYSRGLTLKEVAQAGTEVSNDLKRTMSQAQIENGGVRVKSVSGGAKVLCTGSYSYIANSPTSLEANDGNGDTNAVRIGPSGSTTMARFAKVRDLGGTLCAPVSVLDTNKNYVTDDVSELLSGGSRLLSIRDLSVSPNGIPGTGHPLYQEFQQGRGIYEVRMSIGAGLDSEIDSLTGTCKPPKNANANFDYCAINNFLFNVRVGSSNRQ